MLKKDAVGRRKLSRTKERDKPQPLTKAMTTAFKNKEESDGVIGSICWDMGPHSKNLMCIFGQTLFGDKCILRSIEGDPRGPNGRNNIDKSKLIKLRLYAEIGESINNMLKGITCSKHNKESCIFGITCKDFLCIDCIGDEIHEGHKKQQIEKFIIERTDELERTLAQLEITQGAISNCYVESSENLEKSTNLMTKVGNSLSSKINSEFESYTQELATGVKLGGISSVEAQISEVIQKLKQLNNPKKIHTFDAYQHVQIEAYERFTEFEELDSTFQEEMQELNYFFEIKEGKFRINFDSVDHIVSQERDFSSRECGRILGNVSREDTKSADCSYYTLSFRCKKPPLNNCEIKIISYEGLGCIQGSWKNDAYKLTDKKGPSFRCVVEHKERNGFYDSATIEFKIIQMNETTKGFVDKVKDYLNSLNSFDLLS